MTSRYHGSKISGSQKIASLSNGNFAVRTAKSNRFILAKQQLGLLTNPNHGAVHITKKTRFTPVSLEE